MARRILKCDQETLQKDISGKVYVVTGANSGIGLETARQLVRQGGHVVMACRRVEAGEEQAKTFAGLKGTWEVMMLDLAEMQSVREFADAFLGKYERLDGLVCNAGAVFMGNEAAYTADGFEKTIGVNYLGHFLLTELLLERLKESSQSRMAIVSSVVHAGRPSNRPQVHLDDLHSEREAMEPSPHTRRPRSQMSCMPRSLPNASRMLGSRSFPFIPAGRDQTSAEAATC